MKGTCFLECWHGLYTGVTSCLDMSLATWFTSVQCIGFTVLSSNGWADLLASRVSPFARILESDLEAEILELKWEWNQEPCLNQIWMKYISDDQTNRYTWYSNSSFSVCSLVKVVRCLLAALSFLLLRGTEINENTLMNRNEGIYKVNMI